MDAQKKLQLSKAQAFQRLHNDAGLFVIPNPWDAGSARILASLGFKALATTSAGLAFSMGKPDGANAITLTDVLENATLINNATDLPVSADLENGYGDTPEDCARAVLVAAKAGIAGCSIEDATNKPGDLIYAFDYAVERIRAAVSVVRSLDRPFTLTARAENLIHGCLDLKDTIRRLEAFAEAGADVLYAPGLKTKEEISVLVKAVAPKPVNVLMGLAGVTITVNELADLGVKRVSIGSSLARIAYGSFLRAAQEIGTQGTFTFADGSVSYASLNELFS